MLRECSFSATAVYTFNVLYLYSVWVEPILSLLGLVLGEILAKTHKYDLFPPKIIWPCIFFTFLKSGWLASSLRIQSAFFFSTVDTLRSSRTILIPSAIFSPLTVVYIFWTLPSYSVHVSRDPLLSSWFNVHVVDIQGIICHSRMAAAIVKHPPTHVASLKIMFLQFLQLFPINLSWVQYPSLVSPYSRNSQAYFLIPGHDAFAASYSSSVNVRNPWNSSTNHDSCTLAFWFYHFLSLNSPHYILVFICR